MEQVIALLKKYIPIIKQAAEYTISVDEKETIQVRNMVP